MGAKYNTTHPLLHRTHNITDGNYVTLYTSAPLSEKHSSRFYEQIACIYTTYIEESYLLDHLAIGHWQ